MSADLLRKAATILRGQVDKLTTDTARWDDAFPCEGVTGDRSTYERLFLHPGVGLALADWLDSVARVDLGRGQRETHEACDGDCDVRRAMTVARLIVGASE